MPDSERQIPHFLLYVASRFKKERDMKVEQGLFGKRRGGTSGR
jgi:hypothetical protein